MKSEMMGLDKVKGSEETYIGLLVQAIIVLTSSVDMVAR